MGDVSCRPGLGISQVLCALLAGARHHGDEHNSVLERVALRALQSEYSEFSSCLSAKEASCRSPGLTAHSLGSKLSTTATIDGRIAIVDTVTATHPRDVTSVEKLVLAKLAHHAQHATPSHKDTGV